MLRCFAFVSSRTPANLESYHCSSRTTVLRPRDSLLRTEKAGFPSYPIHPTNTHALRHSPPSPPPPQNVWQLRKKAAQGGRMAPDYCSKGNVLLDPVTLRQTPPLSGMVTDDIRQCCPCCLSREPTFDLQGCSDSMPGRERLANGRPLHTHRSLSTLCGNGPGSRLSQ